MAEHGLLKATIATIIGGVIVAVVGSFFNRGDPPPKPLTIIQSDDPARAWDHVQYTCETPLLESFVNQYSSNSHYVTLAQQRINIIRANQPGSSCYVQCGLQPQDQCNLPCFWDFATSQCAFWG